MENVKKKIALKFIILMGIVSLFGDITYEGARSIAGPYLAVLGASAAMVGLVAGIGEFLGYALKQIGRGLGFGIHETVDQIGAIIGPLIFSAVAFFRGGYRDGFVILWIPAILCVVTLLIGRMRVPSPVALEVGQAGAEKHY